MSLCEFDEDDGRRTFRCAKEATHLISVVSDYAGNPPYELRYCEDHATYYLAGGSGDEVFSVAELPTAPVPVGDPFGDDDDG